MQKEFGFKLYRQKLLTTGITALCTGVVSTSVTQASDIDIYQEAQSGSITLMFMLDTSSSMDSSSSNGANAACELSSSSSRTSETASDARPYIRQYCSVTTASATAWVKANCSPVSGAYRCYDRITRLKDGMYDLLNGSATVNKLADELVIGLSDYSGVRTGSGNIDRGRVVVPARPLKDSVTVQYRRIGNAAINYIYAQCSSVVNGACANWITFTPDGSTFANYSTNFGALVYGFASSAPSGSSTATTVIYSKTASQRQWLSNAITQASNAGGIGASGTNYTPTATTYADTAAYLMGTTTGTGSGSGFPTSNADTKNPENNTKFLAPLSIRNEMAQPANSKSCSGQGIYVLTDGEPRTPATNSKNQTINETSAQTLIQLALGNTGYACANNTQFLGQGAANSGSGDYSGGWRCISNFAVSLLDPAQNPTKLKIKTAVVGFGSLFDGLPKYNKSLAQAQSLQVINNTSGLDVDIANTAKWGIYGQGGYYKGSSSQDIVDSVNSFLGDLTTEIPAVTTGSPTVPRDSLNPAILQKQAYYPQFQPTPDKTYQLWAGNLKKYNVVSGILKDKNSNNIVDAKGRIVDNYDLWSTAISTIQATKDADENTYGSTKFALRGGAWSQLKLKMDANATVENRKLLTNRIGSGAGAATTFGTSSTLRTVKITDLTDTTYQNDVNRGYLMQLLGYNVNAAAPSTITTAVLTAAPELRQIGAVMHSSPLLLTNKGKLTYSNGVLGSDPDTREDYILFGTTQGLLHIVNAKDGKEKFAFVPNEMVDRQKQAFQKYDSTSGGISSLYYGVDGPWTAYTEYVIDSSGNLTVGKGKGVNQKGKQIVYGGLRMGGRSYYALDLHDIKDNDPKLLFQISPDDGKVYNSANPTGKAYSELAKMGESWSKPTIAWVNWGGVRKRVMFVGGGYDAGGANGTANNGGYESDTYNQANKIGGGVYMFDADDGTPLWWASANATNTTTGVIGLKADDLQYSVVSEIRAEDRDSDGLVDHLYFGDLGGQLFRIDLDNNATSTSNFARTPQKLLDLHQTVTASGITIGTSPRFYEMPAFSIYDYAGSAFAVISIGSGNRSRPLQEYAAGTSGRDYDAVYNIYDKDIAARNLYKSGYGHVTTTVTTADLGNGNLGAVTSANRNDNTTPVAAYSKKGWFYQFKSHLLQSAKVFATPIALNNRLFVSTFDGSKDGLSGDCGAGVKGESFLNQFCMPYGQCDKTIASSTGISCSTGDGCSLGAGIQNTAIVDDKSSCDPATETCDDKSKPKPEDGTNNKNYCVATGNRGATITGGTISVGSSKVCLIPQRWYVR